VLFPADFELAASLSWAGLAVEVLVNPGIEPPADLVLDPAVNVVRMPPGSRPQEVDEFALVLSDVVMTDPRSPKDIGLLGMADRQRKPLVAPGEELPALSVVSPDIAGRLNTEMPHWRYCFCHVFGRLEQFFQEAFAFNWRGKARHGFKYSCGRLKLSFLPSWAKDHGPYFAPEDVTGDWRKRVPDRAAADGSALIVKRFNAMDHTALHGSFLHRDLIWFVHFASAWAVSQSQNPRLACHGSDHFAGRRRGYPLGSEGAITGTLDIVPACRRAIADCSPVPASVGRALGFAWRR
jgi:hypothetical protein